MAKTHKKRELWRKTIQLFHEYKEADFIGPFKELGFEYLIEQKIWVDDGHKENEGITTKENPDILASSELDWMIIELTTSDKSKEKELDCYQTAKSDNLDQRALTSHDKKPEIMSSRLSYVNDGPYCQLIVGSELSVKKREKLENPELRKKLKETEDLNLNKLPEIPISFVPEMQGEELREGLIDIVMGLFDPDCEGKETMEIVDQGLERLSNKVGPAQKTSLKTKVEQQMDNLCNQHLEKYLICEDGKYKATENFSDHYKIKKDVTKKLKGWAGREKGQELIEESIERAQEE